MAGQITNLYIDDTSIRLMVTRGKRISKLAEAPLEMDQTDTSAGVREAEIVAKIKQLFKANKVTDKKVVIGLSGLHCLSRPAQLPQLPKTMLNEAVIREARRVLPVPLEQLYLSWQTFPAEEGKMLAFMVAIPRQIADSIISILHEVGVKPYLMEIKPLALARLVQEPTAMVVDIQSREFDIVIISEGIPQPIRTVPFTDEVLSLPDKLQIVKDELKRTIEFFSSNNPEKPIGPEVNIYVSGEALEEAEARESLQNEMEHPVVPLTSPLKCPKHLDPTHYLANAGLSLKEMPREAGPMQINLNTLPDTFLPKPISITKLITLPSAVVAVGVIVLMAVTVQDAAAGINSTSSQLESTNQIINQRQSKKAELEESIAALETQLADAEATSDRFTLALEGISRQGTLMNDDLNAVVDNLAIGVALSNFNHSGKTLGVNGLAPSEVEVLQYARNLVATGRFSEVTLSNITLVGSGDEEEEEYEDEEMGTEDEDEDGAAEEEDESEGNGNVSFTLSITLKGDE